MLQGRTQDERPRQFRMPPKIQPRAQRFSLRMPVQYRPLGEKAWRQGSTQNVSRSGVLIQTNERLRTKTPVEIKLVLPIEIAGRPGASVFCRGHITRTVAPAGAEAAPALAAAITDYNFLAEP